KDFGLVGFEENRHTTYLVFKKPLTEFQGARIIGINYDALRDSPIAASEGTHQPELPEVPAHRPHRVPPQPPKRTRLGAKEFLVRVRIATEKNITVEAASKREAREKAQAFGQVVS